MTKTLKERWLNAEYLAGKWLADGNEHAERGEREKAERCYDKSQYWLDRANCLKEKLWLQEHAHH